MLGSVICYKYEYVRIKLTTEISLQPALETTKYSDGSPTEIAQKWG